MKTLYDVEWVTTIPLDECGDLDIDSAVRRSRRFPSLALAKTFGKRAAAESYWGVAEIRPVREVSATEVQGDDDCLLDWWREGSKLMAYCGEMIEVAV